MNASEEIFGYQFIPDNEAKTVCIQQDDKSIILTETQARDLVKDINFFIKEQTADDLVLKVLELFVKYTEVLKKELSYSTLEASMLGEITKGIQILSGMAMN